MDDIAPKLIEEVNKDFDKNVSNKKVQELEKKAAAGNATYDDAYKYAEEVGKARSKALLKNVTSETLPNGTMYYNIADRLMNDSLSTDHDIVTEYAAKAQEAINKKNGISLKAQTADLDQDRIDGFVNGLSGDGGNPIEEVLWKLGEPVITHARTVVDDTVKKNAEFQNKAGIRATVTRKAAAKCCDWCADLDGDYTYPNVDRAVFQRHDNCRCSLDYEGKKLTAYKSVSGKYNTFRDPDGASSSSRRKWQGYNSKSEYANRFVKQNARMEYAAQRGKEIQDSRRANAIRVENIRNGINFHFNKDGGIISSKVREPIEMDLQFFADKSKQYGKKIGKHAQDFGLDPSKQSDREKMVAIIDDIHRNSDEVRIGHWRGQEKDVLFHIKGNDVVITKQNEEFITVLKDGTNNSGVKNARKK